LEISPPVFVCVFAAWSNLDRFLSRFDVLFVPLPILVISDSSVAYDVCVTSSQIGEVQLQLVITVSGVEVPNSYRLVRGVLQGDTEEFVDVDCTVLVSLI
jgi:hypothetical protein